MIRVYRQRVAGADLPRGQQEAIQVASKELNSLEVGQRNEAMLRWQELYRQRTEFIQEEPTGFVWLYLRK